MESKLFEIIMVVDSVLVIRILKIENLFAACPGATFLDDSAAYITQVWARDFDLPAIARDAGR